MVRDRVTIENAKVTVDKSNKPNLDLPKHVQSVEAFMTESLGW